MHSRFVQANGLSFHVAEYGGEGPPALFVHGTGLVAQVAEPLIAALHADVTAYALDRRGHGDSDKPEEGYGGFINDAHDLAGVVRALGIAGCALVAHSSGGTAAIVAGAEYPGLFSHIVAIDPIIFAARTPGDGPSRMANRVVKRRSTWASTAEMFESLRSKFPYDGWQEEALWAYVRHGTRELPDGSVTLKCPPELEGKMYQHNSGINIFEKLAACTIPLLIIRGGRTDRLPREMAERARATAPACTLVEMPDATHFALMEHPDETALLVRRFLHGEPLVE